jgi:Mrp family chromosome partitioning ATPase/capsular polysaccharide biosynthesis protein
VRRSGDTPDDGRADNGHKPDADLPQWSVAAPREHAGASERAGAPRPDYSEGVLGPYLRAIRARWPLVTLIVVVALAGSLLLVATASRRYEARAEILATPLEGNDPSFLGLDLVRESGDPARTVLTAASVVGSPEAADLTAQRMGPGWDRRRVLAATRIEPQGQSSVLAVVATADNGPLAARLANTFAESSLTRRRETLERQLDEAIARLQLRLEEEGAGEGPAGNATARVLAQQLTALEALQATGRDPTLALSERADIPSAPIGAPAWLTLFAGLLVGLVLGGTAAIAAEALARRVRDQDELVHLYPLPLLAGIPWLPRGKRRAKRSLPAALEAFRTLRAQLQQYGPGRSILLTSASSADGRTTAAVNLGFAFAEAGHRVVLIDLDLRNPELSPAAGVSPQRGLTPLLEGDFDVTDLLLESSLAPGLYVLPAVAGDAVALEWVTRQLPELLSQALRFADYVIIDTSPLGEVSDALRIAAQVDDVVIVTRPRHTGRTSFLLVRDLLDRFGIVPRGLLVVGEKIHTPGAFYMRSSAFRAQLEAGAPSGPSGSR